ncbi:MAG: macrolide ABC transporter ATP-binding protein [Desulfobulbaceae bacterium DB1]|nr:MAG: macrolide ABC transporter ATP-binding protein [Desulfobulbaceae bacterium DB1]
MIELIDINRTFIVGEEKVYGLHAVSLQIRQGEYISIMGPSGSGKSTLLNTIGLLDRPDNGLYRFENRVVIDIDDDERAGIRRQRIGFVFQLFHLVPRLTAAENVELPLIIAEIPVEKRRQRVTTILSSLGLTERAGHRPDQLSGGQRQRVAIARAISMQPAVLLADEPTGNLDKAAGRDVVDILEGLNREGLTLIMVTHDPELGSRARRQIRMEDGRIITDSG